MPPLLGSAHPRGRSLLFSNIQHSRQEQSAAACLVPVTRSKFLLCQEKSASLNYEFTCVAFLCNCFIFVASRQMSQFSVNTHETRNKKFIQNFYFSSNKYQVHFHRRIKPNSQISKCVCVCVCAHECLS